jgi:hypothetical protein
MSGGEGLECGELSAGPTVGWNEVGPDRHRVRTLSGQALDPRGLALAQPHREPRSRARALAFGWTRRRSIGEWTGHSQ